MYLARRTLLTKPAWSVSALLPDPTTPAETSQGPGALQVADLTRLHRLANLAPDTTAEASTLIKDINDLNHFVSHVKELDLTNVEPLVSLTLPSVYDYPLPETVSNSTTAIVRTPSPTKQ
ncbi:hypothetical protein H4R33_006074 [Dimargaris cristalligena]|uniref:Uncharacterized protein n=1 Tax=Dimargaris cristalligena TaxID=215637 RepID=A0A4P9ZP66_9FUNG|nr:hypothetical protein H4R33_006074 [Dimargaris cristalligena]RKP35097.1 hypothetical protein BJ085DRAFT_32810 [Dimargaris cristalligena]|eukprot:RKP35097.1 hypothetical protein BJ085DRAFT_32810 [Dimargaris cristalligena]